MQLSAEPSAIVAAISGALALRLDGIQGQMGMLAGHMTNLKSEVAQLGQHIQHHYEVERQLRDITGGRCPGSVGVLVRRFPALSYSESESDSLALFSDRIAFAGMVS